MTAKDAARIAIDHLRELFLDDVAGQPNNGDFRLEEVDYLPDGGWAVTVSFFRKRAVQPAAPFRFGNVLGLDADREYKTVTLDAHGTVKSIHVRAIPVSR